MAYCKWLKEISKSDLGAATKLAKLMEAGKPVAPSFIITEKAFNDFVKHRKIDFTKLDAFIDTSLTTEMQSEIVDFYKYIDSADDLKYIKSAQALLSAAARDTPFVSVKSDRKSFASVKGVVSLSKAIQECWSASKGEPVIVLISKHSNAERSGVIIPKGKDFEVRASHGFELISPNVYLIDAEDRVTGVEVPGQQIQVIRDDYTSSTLRKEVLKEKQNERVLTDTELAYLSRLARDVEEVLGAPHEVHWQMEKYRLFITDVKEASSKPEAQASQAQQTAQSAESESLNVSEVSQLLQSSNAQDDGDEPEPIPQPEPEPEDEEDEDNHEPYASAAEEKQVMILRLSTALNNDALKQELEANKDKSIFVQVTEREQVEALSKISEYDFKVLLPQYLLDLINELNLDKKKFLPFEDKSL